MILEDDIVRLKYSGHRRGKVMLVDGDEAVVRWRDDCGEVTRMGVEFLELVPEQEEVFVA